MKSIRDHVDPEDKKGLSELGPKSKQNETFPLENNQKTIYISEFGLYSLILPSKLESARVFKRWETKDVLPSIRNTGRYIYHNMNHKYSDSLAFKIENETDLHTKVVSFLKKRYPYSICTAKLGENQDTGKKRIESHKKGYLRGSLDLIITIFINITQDLQLSSKMQKEMAFCQMISLRCCGSIKTMAKKTTKKLWLVMTMAI